MNIFRSSKALLPVFIGLIASFFILKLLIDDVPIDWEELALGKETFSPHVFLENGVRAYAIHDAKIIHCEELDRCIENTSLNNSTNLLWLGNSMLHAINQFKKDQRLASEILHERLIKRNRDLLTISHPSANLQEHLVILKRVILEKEIETLILGLVFDDFREEGVRHDIAKSIPIPKIRETLYLSEIGRKIIKDQAMVLDVEDDFGGLKGSLQDQSERSLNRYLETNFDLWSRRPYLRGVVFNSLYKIRNKIFGINPKTKRKMIRPRFNNNWLALEEIVRVTNEEKINLFVYVAPIRNDVEIPYLESEYIEFKNRLEDFSGREGFYLQNYENLIAPEYWGLKDSTTVDGNPELDFMHFQEGGHIILSETIFDFLESQVDRDK